MFRATKSQNWPSRPYFTSRDKDRVTKPLKRPRVQACYQNNHDFFMSMIVSFYEHEQPL